MSFVLVLCAATLSLFRLQWTKRRQVRLHTTYTHTHTHTPTYSYTHTCIRPHSPTHTHTRPHSPTHTHTHTHTHKHTQTHTNTHIHTHTHICACAFFLPQLCPSSPDDSYFTPRPLTLHPHFVALILERSHTYKPHTFSHTL